MRSKVKTFPVPFALGEIKENISISINSNTANKSSKEQIINQAFKFHSQRKILEAAKYYQHFINEGFQDYRAFANYGAILKDLGKLKEAEIFTRKAIELKPDLAMAHSNLGTILIGHGKLKEAKISLCKAIEIKPDNAEAHSNLGTILKEIGQLKEAEISYRKAIEIKPKLTEAHSNLGTILKDIGRLKEAELSTRKAIELKPDFAEAHSNLGNILKELGKLKEAEVSYHKAIELKPDFAAAYSNLGTVLKNLGKLKEAEVSYRKAIELKPNLAKCYSNLGNIQNDLGKLKEAELSTRKAIELKPDFVEAHSNLGIILNDLGKFSEAFKHFSYASKYAPKNIFYFINSNLRFSPVMNSNSQINNERDLFKKEINHLKNKKDMYYAKPKSFIPSIFYLAYQNRLDDREILEDFADAISKSNGMICNGFSQNKYLASSSKRKNLKIGVCSKFLRSNHSVGKCFLNVLKNLSETDIEMIIYIVPDDKSHFSRKEIYDSFNKIVNLPYCPQIAAKQILEDHLDLIFYPDIGMNSYSYILALSRLALVQVNSLGHGSTSGIKNIDYYITHGIEPTKSDFHYTETLKRFRRLPFNFAIPKIDETKITMRNEINIASNFYMGLIQSLVKLHPSYDKILESILISIKNSYLVLITDKSSYKYKLIKDRWSKKNKLLLERSIFLDKMETDNFLHITRSCDIMLEPFYFGGGVTFYESMAFGIPFVTYPHNQKVRIASAGYKQMKIKNPPIAKSPEDYINWCKSYAKDKLLLESTKKELREKAVKYLFNDNKIYEDYYNFFKDAVKNATLID